MTSSVRGPDSKCSGEGIEEEIPGQPLVHSCAHECFPPPCPHTRKTKERTQKERKQKVRRRKIRQLFYVLNENYR